MQPAAAKAPLDYLFALVVSALAIGLSFDCDPRSTGWVVFASGVVMALAVIGAGLRPVPRDR